MYFDFQYNFCLKYFSLWEELSEIWSKTYIGLRVQYHFILVRLKWTFSFLDRFLKKCSNIKFHENSSHGSRVVPCGKTGGQTGKIKLTAAFRKYAKAPKKNRVSSSIHVLYSSPDITSVIKPRMMMWVGSCGTHVCVETSKYTTLLHLEDTDTPGTDGSAWQGNTSRDKKQDLFTFPELWFRQRETWARSVAFYRPVLFKFWIPLI